MPVTTIPGQLNGTAVFRASADGFHNVYRAAAEELGKALAGRGIGLIYNGAKPA